MFGVFKKKEKTAESSAKTGSAWRGRLSGIFSRSKIDDDFWDELEEALVISDVGVNTTMSLIDDLRNVVKDESIKEPDQVRVRMRDLIAEMLTDSTDVDPIPDDEPVVLLIVGVNGAGKTTSIAKLVDVAKSEGKNIMLAAADTFRAGAIEQIKIWGDRLDVPVIAQAAGSDPGAVAFDALNAARARNVDLLIIDTAGRLHTTHNLMEELRKIRGIVEKNGSGFTERIMLVIDGTTGQNGMIQAKSFTEAVNCNGVFLTKLDGTAKGGVALAISGELGLPIWFIGTGEKSSDMSAFDPDAFAAALLPEPNS
ncbi:MAG: signal recognition particle-docking protein FtsY [Chloroflexi bacterium]|nr:signal recognition particle-docking protein FtsY [Chloroflexota bacterium]MBT3862176.1 signal recognition particle-docking protein FtsY [Chloroflexota bacterium]MBT4943937.1 signal recognition particle-docking protein FtsY [Chloroflexota bacterium]